MQFATIDEHDIEYEAVQVPGTAQWSAYLAIYGPSHNPMHRNSIFPHQHVAVNDTFTTSEAAEEAALAVAKSLLASRTNQS